MYSPTSPYHSPRSYEPTSPIYDPTSPAYVPGPTPFEGNSPDDSPRYRPSESSPSYMPPDSPLTELELLDMCSAVPSHPKKDGNVVMTDVDTNGANDVECEFSSDSECAQPPQDTHSDDEESKRRSSVVTTKRRSELASSKDPHASIFKHGNNDTETKKRWAKFRTAAVRQHLPANPAFQLVTTENRDEFALPGLMAPTMTPMFLDILNKHLDPITDDPRTSRRLDIPYPQMITFFGPPSQGKKLSVIFWGLNHMITVLVVHCEQAYPGMFNTLRHTVDERNEHGPLIVYMDNADSLFYASPSNPMAHMIEEFSATFGPNSPFFTRDNMCAWSSRVRIIIGLSRPPDAIDEHNHFLFHQKFRQTVATSAYEVRPHELLQLRMWFTQLYNNLTTKGLRIPTRYNTTNDIGLDLAQATLKHNFTIGMITQTLLEMARPLMFAAQGSRVLPTPEEVIAMTVLRYTN